MQINSNVQLHTQTAHQINQVQAKPVESQQQEQEETQKAQQQPAVKVEISKEARELAKASSAGKETKPNVVTQSNVAAQTYSPASIAQHAQSVQKAKQPQVEEATGSKAS
ncbi:hypothetical protein PP175_29065 (plasmid) [Aneurinibacillus sp. Ricciae_BoGa-3]|uniref:hypothetical protein n=1 Tax=Aneurinibacillus sp. Ricciae_BoGa-3 TaxID=3022697 RepID=UPI0023411357|nr:hypothetical protein [Aneurinibacillus sp. Ricciae_BoGa-3]WCK57243.1 hypothetical protein PP175_29065 [Aneurinibacillus sp. Ricciae_BoGa-3]